MPKPHIVVVGLGATGSAALRELAQRNARAIGIEQFQIGHERGSSHGPTRVIRLMHFESPAYTSLMQEAYRLWHKLEETVGHRLLHLTGIAEIGPPDGTIVNGTIAAARAANVEPKVQTAKELMRRYPAFSIPDRFIAVLHPDGGYIEARGAIEANIRIATDAGAQIRSGECVLALEPTKQGVRVRTDKGIIDADGAIVAAGPWMNAVLQKQGLKLPLRVTRQVVGWFEPRDPALFAADRFPVFILESEYGNHYGFPAYRGMGVKIAKHHHLDETVDLGSYETDVTQQDEAVIREPLARYLPGANGALLAAETCLYTMTPDDTFIVDRMPDCPQIVIASPCCGHGFKFSPAIARIVSDLVLRGATDHDIGRFRLSRFD
jgi:sarcosine oxidase